MTLVSSLEEKLKLGLRACVFFGTLDNWVHWASEQRDVYFIQRLHFLFVCGEGKVKKGGRVGWSMCLASDKYTNDFEGGANKREGKKRDVSNTNSFFTPTAS